MLLVRDKPAIQQAFNGEKVTTMRTETESVFLKTAHYDIDLHKDGTATVSHKSFLARGDDIASYDKDGELEGVVLGEKRNIPANRFKVIDCHGRYEMMGTGSNSATKVDKPDKAIMKEGARRWTFFQEFEPQLKYLRADVLVHEALTELHGRKY